MTPPHECNQCGKEIEEPGFCSKSCEEAFKREYHEEEEREQRRREQKYGYEEETEDEE